MEVGAWGTEAACTTAAVRWLVSDQLGTPRMIVDRTGSLAGTLLRNRRLRVRRRLYGKIDTSQNAQQSQPSGRFRNFTVNFPAPASNISFQGIGVHQFNTTLTSCAYAAVIDIYVNNQPPNTPPKRMVLCGRMLGEPIEKPVLYDLNKIGISSPGH